MTDDSSGDGSSEPLLLSPPSKDLLLFMADTVAVCWLMATVMGSVPTELWRLVF